MFRVVVAFADMQDGGYIYRVGDVYPRDGLEVGPSRLEELSSTNNRIGAALIVEEGTEEDAPEAKKGVDDVEVGVSPSKTPGAKKKARKG